MKWIRFISAMAILAILVNCGSDPILDGDRPTITVTATSGSGPTVSDGGSILATDSVEFLISVSAPAGFNSILIGGSTNTALTQSDAGVGTSEIEVMDVPYKVFTNVEDGGALASFIFVAVDNLGQMSDSVKISFDITQVVDLYSNITLGGFENISNGSFLDAINNSVFSVANATFNASQIDLLFYHQTSYTIASPDDGNADAAIESQTATGDLDNLSPRNQTRFKVFSSTIDFNGILSIDELQAAYNSSTSSNGVSEVTGLTTNSHIGFVIDSSRGSRIGIMRVLETAGTTGSNRAIRFDLKIEPE